MIPAADDHAAQRTDVPVITAPRDGDVAVAGEEIVRRVSVDPAMTGTPHGEPGVRGIRADQPRLARRRQRLEVAADVARRQAERAQAGDGEVREILADAAASS